MSKLIKVTPEQLLEIGNKFLASSNQNNNMATELEKLINGLSGQWQGVSKERFYTAYSNADKDLKQVSILLKDVGDELKAIANRFKEADEVN